MQAETGVRGPPEIRRGCASLLPGFRETWCFTVRLFSALPSPRQVRSRLCSAFSRRAVASWWDLHQGLAPFWKLDQLWPSHAVLCVHWIPCFCL